MRGSFPAAIAILISARSLVLSLVIFSRAALYGSACWPRERYAAARRTPSSESWSRPMPLLQRPQHQPRNSPVIWQWSSSSLSATSPQHSQGVPRGDWHALF